MSESLKMPNDMSLKRQKVNVIATGRALLGRGSMAEYWIVIRWFEESGFEIRKLDMSIFSHDIARILQPGCSAAKALAPQPEGLQS